MIGTGIHGFNAAQVILASGFSGLTDLGSVPESIVSLAALPEPVRLVRADESVNFHLAQKSDDPIRSDTAIYRWLVDITRSVIESPDYYVASSRPGQFQLLKHVAAPAKYPTREFVLLLMQYASGAGAPSGAPELRLRSAVILDAKSARRYFRKGVALASNNALEQTRGRQLR